MVEIHFYYLDFCHQKIVRQLGINCSINNKKCFFHPFLCFFRMFLFKTDIFMLITKLDSYTKNLLIMCSSSVQICVFSKAEQFKSSYGKKSILLFGICHQKTVRQLGMSCSINNKNCFFHPFLVFLWSSFLKRITICWWSNWIHTLKAYQTCKTAQFLFMFFLRRSNLIAARVESQFSSLDFYHQKIVKQFEINCSINSKIVPSILFLFF